MKYLLIFLMSGVACSHKIEQIDNVELSSCFIEVCRIGVVCRYQVVGITNETYIVKYNEQTQNRKQLNTFIRSYTKFEFHEKMRKYAGLTNCRY